MLTNEQSVDSKIDSYNLLDFLIEVGYTEQTKYKISRLLASHTVGSFAFQFYCMPVGRTSDSMKVLTKRLIY